VVLLDLITHLGKARQRCFHPTSFLHDLDKPKAQ